MKLETKYIVIGGGVLVTLIGAYFILRKKNDKGIVSSFDSVSGGSGHSSSKGDYISEPDWDKPFDMNYKKHVESYLKREVKGLDSLTAKRYAKKLKDAKKPFYKTDDTESVAQIFGKSLKDKVQVSDLSRAFWNSYKLDLWKHLTTFLSSSELTRYIRKPLRVLPNYRF